MHRTGSRKKQTGSVTIAGEQAASAGTLPEGAHTRTIQGGVLASSRHWEPTDKKKLHIRDGPLLQSTQLNSRAPNRSHCSPPTEKMRALHKFSVLC